MKDPKTVSDPKPVKKGSKTEENLWKAFAGEAQARNKYTYFAQIAREQGYENIAAVFEETAQNELEHAKVIWKLLGKWQNTENNLKMAIEGEHYEWTKMYPEFEKIAREEGFQDAVLFFKEVAEVEEEHEKRFKRLLEELQNGEIFKRKEKTMWVCRNCGYLHWGKEAPLMCPNCRHPQKYFEVRCQY
jgi:rubrerythrin